MESSIKKNIFNKILAAIAFSPNLKSNIFESMRLANMLDAQLILVHAGTKNLVKEKKIESIIAEIPHELPKLKILWINDSPIKVVLDSVIKHNIDLLILGAQKRENLVNFYLGSIARKLTRQASCSILLLIKPSVNRMPCKHIVTEGFVSNKFEKTLTTSINLANVLGTEQLTVVDEISKEEIKIEIEDDKSLNRSLKKRREISTRESEKIQEIISNLGLTKLSPNLKIKIQNIFGRRGYSISHYALVKRADLLILNKPDKKYNLLDRIFPHDIEYILSDLPTDILLLRNSTKNIAV